MYILHPIKYVIKVKYVFYRSQYKCLIKIVLQLYDRSYLKFFNGLIKNIYKNTGIKTKTFKMFETRTSAM